MIKVVVANRPRLMRDMVLATIADQADIQVLAEVEDESDIARVVEEKQPDFLIIALDSSGRRPSLCDSLLHQYPAMKILALAAEQDSSVFFWASLDIHSHFVEASAEGVLETLRSSPARIGGYQ